MNLTQGQYLTQTQSPKETIQLGKTIGRNLLGGLSIGLVGGLGSGKTHLVKGIAAGNNPNNKTKVTSPTFTLINEYPGQFRLCHADVYRLKSTEEFAVLGTDEMITEDSVLVTEWADRVMKLLPDDTLWIRIEVTAARSRSLAFDPTGPQARKCLDAIQRCRR